MINTLILKVLNYFNIWSLAKPKVIRDAKKMMIVMVFKSLIERVSCFLHSFPSKNIKLEE